MRGREKQLEEGVKHDLGCRARRKSDALKPLRLVLQATSPWRRKRAFRRIRKGMRACHAIPQMPGILHCASLWTLEPPCGLWNSVNRECSCRPRPFLLALAFVSEGHLVRRESRKSNAAIILFTPAFNMGFEILNWRKVISAVLRTWSSDEIEQISVLQAWKQEPSPRIRIFKALPAYHQHGHHKFLTGLLGRTTLHKGQCNLRRLVSLS